MAAPAHPRSAAEIGQVFLRLGLTCFGGPIAHLARFHTEFVTRRRWLGEDEFADLVALCQFLPGPASSQVVLALGMRWAGVSGAFAASAAFTLPSAALMVAFAYGVALMPAKAAAGPLHGLKLAAVAVVAQAVWAMSRSLCPDGPRRVIGLMAAGAACAFHAPWVQAALIGVGGLLGWAIYRRGDHSRMPTDPPSRRSHAGALAALVVFFALLVVPLGLPASTLAQPVRVLHAFYRSGALVFGGGHAVLPLLHAEVVPTGWITEDDFVAGYGAAQAMPGPLFTFAGFLGARMFDPPHSWLGGVACLLALFLPGWLLIAGVLPFWHRLRSRQWAQASLRGANAAVVGLLLAALWSPLITQTVRGVADAAVALAAITLLIGLRTPPVMVVIACAAAGAAVH